MPPTLTHEFVLKHQGFGLIAGIDEAGRGAWAGPVVAAAVILPIDQPNLPEMLTGVDDSKKRSAKQRELLRERIQHHALSWSVGSASAQEIDALGIVPATRFAMQRAIEGLHIQAQALLIDAVQLPDIPLPQQAFHFADAISLSVAAASILAKTSRDAMLMQLDSYYHGYGFAKHKGYGTQIHRDALQKLGVTPEHRRSYAPITQLINL